MTSLTRPARWTLELGGHNLSPDVQGRLTSLRVQQRVSLPAVCELVLVGRPFPLAEPGTALKVGVDGTDCFSGEVTAVTLGCLPDGTQELTVRAYDRLHRLRKRSPLQARSDLTLSGLASDLAASLSLTLDLDAGLPGPVWTSHLQTGASDFQLLSDLAERVGASFMVTGERLRIYGPGGAGDPVPLVLGNTLLEAAIAHNVEALRDGVHVTGWDLQRSEAVNGRAALEDGDPLPGDFGATDRELAGLELGAQQAQTLARAELEHGAASVWTLQGAASGDPRLAPGTNVSVSGLGSGWDRTFTLTEVTHTLDPRLGYLSEVSSRPPPRRPLTSGSGAVATLGVVTDVQDPLIQGRVRVALSAYGDLQGDWMPVVGVAAGSGKGLMALPDTGDRVLALLTRGDPAQGVVLGGLYGPDGPADAGLTGEGVRRYTLRTAAGERLLLDADRGGVTVQDRAGSTLEFLPGGVRLSAQADLLIEAPGRRITIRADRIDFERG